MWALSIFSFLLGLTILFIPLKYMQERPGYIETNKAKVEAENFIQYRNAVRFFLTENPSHTGEVTSLDLPGTWEDLNLWDNHIQSKTAYIYSQDEPSSGVEGIVMKELNYPINTGIKRNGKLISQAPAEGSNLVITDDVNLPSSIPDGSLVSLFRVN